MTFEKWLEIVDFLLIDATGLDSSTLPDWGWDDAYDAGISTVDATNSYLDEIISDYNLG